MPPEETPSQQKVAAFCDLQVSTPETPIILDLPGETLSVAVAEAGLVFARPFKDIETLLALHRFAWLPLAGQDVDRRWVDALWRAWVDGFGEVDGGWAWHPYTAAERAINIVDFAQRFGLPGDREKTIDVLVRHVGAIANH